MKKHFFSTLAITFITLSAYSQPVCTPWGNIDGILIDGEKMEIETSVRSVNTDWTGYVKTEKYNWEGNQTYEKQNNSYTVKHSLLGLPLDFTSKMTGTEKGAATAEVILQAGGSVVQAGTFFCCEVQGKDFSNGNITFFKNGKKTGFIELIQANKNEKGELIRVSADKITLQSNNRQYEIVSPGAFEVILRNDFTTPPAYMNDPWPSQKITDNDPFQEQANYQLYFTLIKGNAKKGDQRTATFKIKTAGTIDRADVNITLDTKKPGREFEGIGGNFRLQYPEKDSAVIQYCLDNLNVTWARVPMYWDDWQPEENINPEERALSGKLQERFYRQMELTRMLAKRGMKIIISVWTPPSWAVDKNI